MKGMRSPNAGPGAGLAVAAGRAATNSAATRKPNAWLRSAAGPPVNAPARPIMALLSLIIILAYSRLIEVIGAPGLFLVAGIVLIYGLGTTQRGDGWLSSPATLLLLGLTIWMLPSAFFGVWRGGSFKLLTDTWSRVLLYYTMVACLARDLNSMRQIMRAMAWAALAIVVLSAANAVDTFGRLGVAAASLSNPNDLAVFLLVALPFAAWYVASTDRPMVFRALMALALIYGLLTLLRTGSRMGLLALIAVSLVLFAVAGRGVRLLLAVGAVTALLAVVFLLPPDIKLRYKTIFSEVSEEQRTQQVEFAAASAEGRWELFINSLRVTWGNPLFGVGPGNYTGANARLGEEAGERRMWMQAHNAYTQTSAECGIPGGIMYLMLVIFVIRVPLRVWRARGKMPALRAHSAIALCLLIAAAAYAFCAIFGSVAYSTHLALLAALAGALQHDYRRALAAQALVPRAS